MGNLSIFLKDNVEQVENEKVVVSKRFKGADGKAVPFEVKAITTAEDDAIRKKCTKRVQVPGKRNQFTQEFDSNGYLLELAAACVVYPDLKSKELQDSYEVRGEAAVLGAMLTAGELGVLAEKVQEINGFNGFDELVEEAKN